MIIGNIVNIAWMILNIAWSFFLIMLPYFRIWYVCISVQKHSIHFTWSFLHNWSHIPYFCPKILICQYSETIIPGNLWIILFLKFSCLFVPPFVSPHFLHASYIHASGWRIIDIRIIHTCINIKDQGHRYMQHTYMRHTHMHQDQRSGSFVLKVLIFHLVGSGWDGHSGNKHGWDQSHCLPSQSPTNHPQIFLTYQFFCTEN